MRSSRCFYLFFLITTLCSISLHVFAQTTEKCTGERIFTAKVCLGDSISPDEQSLFDTINKFRTDNGRPTLKLSAALSMVGNRRMLDIAQNMRMLTHSWSNCPYDIKDEKTWPCQTNSPRRLNSGYIGEGYETLYRTTDSKVEIAAALAAWKKSSLHNSIILSQGMFESMPWDELGVAISGSYAALWFGYTNKKRPASLSGPNNATESYDLAITNVFKVLAIGQRSATTEPNGLRGFSGDQKLKVDIWGTKRDISLTTIAITAKTSPDGKIDAANKSRISRLLSDRFPEWSDTEGWIDNSTNLIAQNRSAWKTKTIRGIVVEMKAAGPDAVVISIKPPIKNAPIEM